MQQRDAYEDGKPSHVNTILKKDDAVNAKAYPNAFKKLRDYAT